ncbi:MAG: MBL fold metallo-hydrolase [Proteobacteria bacterium]|nr:MBL fold metallo-hydrolase [Pseudomonadota bacterium]
MPVHKRGPIAEDVYVLGNAGMPAFLLDGDRPTLIDAGLDCLAPAYLGDIERFLAGRPPSRLLLTHSHFDHVGAAPALLRRYPGIEVGASARAAEVLGKPSVRAMIRDLNRAATRFFAGTEFDLTGDAEYEPFTGFEVTRILEEGDWLTLSPESTLQVIAAPGHTRDFLCYYVPERRILVASEAGGTILPHSDHIVSEHLVSYGQYRDSLCRLAELPTDLILLGHHYHLVGPEARAYLERSLESSQRFHEWVAVLLTAENGRLERVMDRVRAEEWDARPLPKQPLAAYLLNLRERVRCVRDDLGLRAEGPAADAG